MNTLLLVLPLLISTFFVFCITPFVIRFANYVKIIDDPHKNKHVKVTHTTPTPRGGGLAVYIGFVLTVLIFLPLDKHIIGILLGATLITFLGLADDKWDLSPYLRFSIQLIAASIPVAFGIGISFVTNPWGGIIDLSHPQIQISLFGENRSLWILSDVFAICWLVFLMNILNMGAKGLPGQLSGVTVLSAATIALLSMKYSADITEWPVIILALILAGSFLGHLPWNIFPQRIMPSFGGSNLAGFLLGILAILSTAKIGTLFVVLGIPIIDTMYTIVRRISTGKSPFWGDRGHLHHKLLDSGLSKNTVTFIYWIFTALLGALALNLNASYKLYTIVGIIISVGGLLLLLTHIIKNETKA